MVLTIIAATTTVTTATIILQLTAGLPIPRFSKNTSFTTWVQNRPYDLLRPAIDMKFYGEPCGHSQKK